MISPSIRHPCTHTLHLSRRTQVHPLLHNSPHLQYSIRPSHAPPLSSHAGLGLFRTFSSDAVIWHKPGAPENGRVTYDELFELIWRSAHKKAFNGDSGGGGKKDSRSGGEGEEGDKPVPPFDMAAYIAHEVGVHIAFLDPVRPALPSPIAPPARTPPHIHPSPRLHSCVDTHTRNRWAKNSRKS